MTTSVFVLVVLLSIMSFIFPADVIGKKMERALLRGNQQIDDSDILNMIRGKVTSRMVLVMYYGIFIGFIYFLALFVTNGYSWMCEGRHLMYVLIGASVFLAAWFVCCKQIAAQSLRDALVSAEKLRGLQKILGVISEINKHPDLLLATIISVEVERGSKMVFVVSTGIVGESPAVLAAGLRVAVYHEPGNFLAKGVLLV